jgi:ubiquinone/menaquinone biosynthesis C-methylase UbiE
VQYGTVASMYDAYVTTTVDVPFLINEAKKVSGHVLELMAGTGRVTVPLAQAGVHVTAVDQSSEMLAILRQKLAERHLEVEVHEMDVRDLSLPRRFAAVLIPFHSFSELVTRPDQERTLAAVHRHLQDHGKLILPLQNPVLRLRDVNGQFRLQGRQVSADGSTVLLWTQQTYEPSTRTVSGVEFFEQYATDGTMRVRVMVDLAFHVFDRGEVERLVASAGFRILALYGDYAYAAFHEQSSPFMIWVLEKRDSLSGTEPD